MNILVLTSVYPQVDDEKDTGVTSVVKYFAEEWSKLGHKIIVVHNSNYFPIINLMPNKWLKKINSKFGVVLPNKNQRKRLINENKSTISIRLPMLKVFPKKSFFDFQINKQYKEIKRFLKEKNFKPDIIVGHWENPQIPLLSLLKKDFGSRTCLVFHGIVYLKQGRYRKKVEHHLKNIDVIGARSKVIADEVKRLISLKTSPFICYSGIPDIYLNYKKYPITKFNEKTTNSYLYVGRLIKRKNVDTIIKALTNIYNKKKYNLNIVGEGAEKNNLEKLINKLDAKENIKLLGYKDRDEVVKLMDSTEVFIMVSNNETFGLVYIEAMSRGCIVIASRFGGMDGIIKDGFNGFLCEQGNELELAELCKRIKNMPLEEKIRISKNAMLTATKFSDTNVAKTYLNNIIS